MKSINKYFILILFLVCSNTLFAQYWVDRTTSLPTSADNCETIQLDYVLTSDSGYSWIEISENFTPVQPCSISGTIPVVNIAPGASLPSGSAISYNVSSGSFDVRITNIPATGSTAINFSILLQLRVPDDMEEMEFCTNGVQLSSSPASPAGTATPNTPECITVKNNATWRTNIQCVEQTGVNCFVYTIDVTDLSTACDANVYGIPRFRFNAPNNSIITSITDINFGTTNVTPTGTSFIEFTSNQNTWTQNTTREQYRIEVQYPCDSFSDGDMVQVNFNHINNIGGTAVRYGNSCPTVAQGSLFEFAPSSKTIEIKDPFLNASLVVSDAYGDSKHTPGCDNKAFVRFTNTGNTIIDNTSIDITIPNTIQINSLCGNTPDAYRLTGQPWQIGAPTAAQYAQIEGLRFNETTDISAPRLCGDTQNYSSITIPICYSINPTTPIGTDINICALATFDDKVNCTAANCPNYNVQNRTINNCLDYETIEEIPNPTITKKMHPGNSPSMFQNDWREFDIVVSNSGSGNLITNVVDAIPTSEFQNVSITNIEYSLAGGAWTNPPTGMITSQSITVNTVNVGLNIPGICNLSSSCCSLLSNRVKITVRAQVIPCLEATNGIEFNYAKLLPQGLSDAQYYQVLERNRLEVQKFAKGDAGAEVSGKNNLTEVSPGGNIDYRIVIKNNDPDDWNDFTLVDYLPHIGATDTRLCNSSDPRGSTMNVELRSPVTVTRLTGSPLVLGDYDIFYTNTYDNRETDFCPGVGVPTISGPFSSGKKGFKIKFYVPIECNDEIEINIPAKVDGTQTSGFARNSAHYVTSENELMGSVYADAEIVTWELDCCDDYDLSIDNPRIKEYQEAGTSTHDRVAISWDTSWLSNIPVQEVRLSVIDFKYNQNFDDCKKCNNSFRGLGALSWQANAGNFPASGGGLVGVNDPNGSGVWDANREAIWELGTPVVMNTPTEFGIWLNLPEGLKINSCKGCIEICVKLEVMDMNCNTCDVIECFTVDLMEHDYQENDTCEDSITTGSGNNPNGNGNNPNGNGNNPNGNPFGNMINTLENN